MMQIIKHVRGERYIQMCLMLDEVEQLKIELLENQTKQN